MNMFQKMYLAMVWDRVDIAEEKILAHESTFIGQDSEEIMLEAILHERVNFIDLLLLSGFVLRHFLTVERLEILYNDSVLN